MSDFSFSALPAANLTGTLPAIDGSSLTGLTVSDSAITSAKLHGDLFGQQWYDELFEFLPNSPNSILTDFNVGL